MNHPLGLIIITCLCLPAQAQKTFISLRPDRKGSGKVSSGSGLSGGSIVRVSKLGSAMMRTMRPDRKTGTGKAMGRPIAFSIGLDAFICSARFGAPVFS